MKIMRLMVFGLLLSTAITTFISCSDDNDSRSKVLLRPVTTMTTNANEVQLTWKNVEGASEYVVDIYRVTDSGTELYKSDSTTETSLTIALDWDDSYQVKIKCMGNGVESAYWETDPITLTFPTKLGQTRTIDTQALITWEISEEPITAITAAPVGSTAEEDIKLFEVSSEDYATGEMVITGLEPETSYKIRAYRGSEQTFDTYEGSTVLTTVAAEDFNAEYGSNLIDLRNEAYDPEYFNNLDWNVLPEGATFILPEGKSYNINKPELTIELSHSVNFVTPQTLGEYATFRFDNAFRVVADGSIDKITFKRVNLRAAKELSAVTDNGLSGKQVVCPEVSNFFVNTISFTDCYIENFRSVVRSKYDSGNVETISFDGCTINAIGNQGIVSTDGKKGYINNVSFNECTVTNICGIADLRNDGSGKNVSITNSTFCYAPMENSFLFRVHSSVAVSIENCIFGGPMKIDGKLPLFNQIGSAGQDDYTGNYPFKPVNSFQSGDHVSTKGSLGLSSAKMDSNTLFQDPANGNFKLSGSFSGCSSVGATKWRIQ